jgi:predicted permease
MSSLVHDFRYAVRALLKAPRMSALVVIMMALAIGAGTAVFSIVDQTVLRSAPFVHADRLVNVSGLVAKAGGGGSILTPMKIAGWQTQPSVFERFEGYTYRQFDVTGTAEPERIGGLDISTELLPMLGVSPQFGRGFVEGEGHAGGPRVALISDDIWRRRFGAARDILARQIVLNDQPYTIVGVMPRRFRLIAEDESVWLPIDIKASAGDNSAARFHGVARLRPGLDVMRAQQDVDRIADHLQATAPIARSWYLKLEKKLVAYVNPTTKTALFVLLGAVAFVLLTACANVANLLLTNTVRRGREMAIKSALGANRARLMRQVLFEGVLLATLGGALGILLAIWGLDVLLAAAPDDLAFRRTVPVDIDGRVVAVTAFTSLVTGILFALIPAVRGSRPNLMPALHGVASGNRDRASFGRIPSALVVAEVGLSLVLLVGTALMMRTLIKLETLDPGFDPRNVVSIELGLPTDRYPTVESRAAFFDELSQRFAASGRTRGMALANGVPEGGHTWGTAVAEGSSRPPEEFESVINNVSPDYFRLLGIPLRAGRVFENDDVPGAIVVSRALAERFWGSAGSAVGRRFRTSDKSPWRTVVGVAENVAGAIGEERTSLLIYYPWPRRSAGTPSKPVPGQRSYARHILLVRADNPLGAVPVIKSHIWTIDKNQTIENVRLVEDIHAETFGRQRFVLWLMAAFAVVAVVMTVTGLFGVLAQAVAQRRREIGIRMALGASPHDMFKLIVLRGMMLTFGGVALGLFAAFWLSNLLAALLFEMSPHDPISFAGVALLFLGIAAVACWLPARAAMRVQPSSALRTE